MIFKGRGLSKKHFNKKVSYIIDDFLVSGAITMIYAPPKNGKSSFAMGLCKWLMDNTDLYPFYLDYDNPTIALEDRKVNKIIEEYQHRFDYIHPDEVKMTAKSVIDELLNDVKRIDYSKVVLFFDSVKHFVSDISSDGTVNAFMEKMKILRSAGITIILLHHTNKNEANYKGSGGLLEDSDNVFSLTSETLNIHEGNMLLERKVARFGKVKSTAFNLRKDNWAMKAIDYKDAQLPYHVREFIKEVRRILTKEKQLNQTKLLEAMNKDKADRTSLDLLTEYTGRFWAFEEKGKAKLYTLI